MRLLVVTPWKEDWDGDQVGFPEVLHLKGVLRSVFEYEVISPGEKPKSDGYDVIWAQSERVYRYARALADNLKPLKFVVSIYGIYDRFPLRFWTKVFRFWHLRRFKLLDEALSKGADLFVISDDGSMGDKLAEMYKVNYVFLKNARPLWKPIDKRLARLKLGLPPEGVIGTFIGRFLKLKGVHLISKIFSDEDGYTLLAVGTGPLMGVVKKLSGLKRFVYHKPIKWPDMHLVYSASDFILMPYLYGNKTAVMVESLSMGLPVVSFKAHTTDTVIRDGWNGLLVDNFKVRLFRERCLSLVRNPDLRAYISKNALKSSEIFPTWDEYVDKLVNLLKP